jgi:hypothetical protein
VKALISARTVTPAHVGLSCQPAGATPLGISREDARTVQHLIPAALRLPLLDQEQGKGHDHITRAPLQAIELLTLRQRGNAARKWRSA